MMKIQRYQPTSQRVFDDEDVIYEANAVEDIEKIPFVREAMQQEDFRRLSIHSNPPSSVHALVVEFENRSHWVIGLIESDDVPLPQFFDKQ